jgi:DNA polymerase elongation subunit (family B)
VIHIILSAVIVVYNLDGSAKIPPLKNINENCKVTYVEDEASLVHELVKCVKKWDPDILGGYEVIEIEMFEPHLHSFKLFSL